MIPSGRESARKSTTADNSSMENVDGAVHSLQGLEDEKALLRPRHLHLRTHRLTSKHYGDITE